MHPFTVFHWPAHGRNFAAIKSPRRGTYAAYGCALRSGAFLLAAFFIFPSFALCAPQAREIIERFDAFATVSADSSVQVTERIVVRSDADRIRRGIFRVLANKGVSGYEILSVRRNNRPEPYSVKSSRSGRTVYIGDKDVVIARGQHIYEISYRVLGAVRFQENFDEFYWNVTGNDWQFPIQAASLRLTLPPGAQMVSGGISLYTGYAGESGPASARASGDSFFFTTRPLAAGEGFTVSAAWNKGVVKEPSAAEKITSGLAGYSREIGWFSFAWVLLLAYYACVWYRVGRDPRSRVLRRFEPPAGLSAAQVRYLRQMKSDSQMLSVIIMSLVQKGCISVTKNGADRFVLTRTDPQTPVLLSGEEQAFVNELFKSRTEITVSNRLAQRFQAASAAVRRALKEWEGGRFFTRNAWFNAPTFLFAAALVGALGAKADWPNRFTAVYITAFMSVWFYGMFGRVLKKWWPRAVNFGRYALAALAAVLFVLLGAAQTALVLVALAPGIIFYYLVRAYTPLGRQHMDDVEGFLQYLEVAEKYRVFASDPTDAARIYCDYLPYAAALDVQNKWRQTLQSELGEAAAERVAQSRGFGFVSSGKFTAFSSALASACVPPGSSSSRRSSSGFGGGGSSGGGSGGGGGGGW